MLSDRKNGNGGRRSRPVRTTTTKISDRKNGNAGRRSRPVRGNPDASQLHVDSETEYANMSWKWWHGQLKPSGWIRFTPEEKYCEQHGFIPVQYTTGIWSKENKNKPRKVMKYVMQHGQRGIHYAIGWLELYRLVKKFASLELCDETYPGTWHELIMDYKGPPLLGVSTDSLEDEKPHHAAHASVHEDLEKRPSQSDFVVGEGRRRETEVGLDRNEDTNADVTTDDVSKDQGSEKRPLSTGNDIMADADIFADAQEDYLDFGERNESKATGDGPSTGTGNGLAGTILCTIIANGKVKSRKLAATSFPRDPTSSKGNAPAPVQTDAQRQQTDFSIVSTEEAPSTVAASTTKRKAANGTCSGDPIPVRRTELSSTTNETGMVQQAPAEDSAPPAISIGVIQQLEKSTASRRDSDSSLPSLESESSNGSATSDLGHKRPAKRTNKKPIIRLSHSGDKSSQGKSRVVSSKQVNTGVAMPEALREHIQPCPGTSSALLDTPITAVDGGSLFLKPTSSPLAESSRNKRPNDLLLRISEYRSPATTVSVQEETRKAAGVRTDQDSCDSKKNRRAEEGREAPQSTVQDICGSKRKRNTSEDQQVEAEAPQQTQVIDTTPDPTEDESADPEKIAMAAFMAGFMEVLYGKVC
jgi:hypothetical protein